MAAVTTVTDSFPATDTKQFYFGTIAFDSSYPTGGEAITIANCENIKYLHAAGASGYNFAFVAGTQKLQAFRTDQVDDPEEEVPSTTDLSGLTAIPFLAIGQ